MTRKYRQAGSDFWNDNFKNISRHYFVLFFFLFFSLYPLLYDARDSCKKVTRNYKQAGFVFQTAHLQTFLVTIFVFSSFFFDELLIRDTHPQRSPFPHHRPQRMALITDAFLSSNQHASHHLKEVKGVVSLSRERHERGMETLPL